MRKCSAPVLAKSDILGSGALKNLPLGACFFLVCDIYRMTGTNAGKGVERFTLRYLSRRGCKRHL